MHRQASTSFRPIRSLASGSSTASDPTKQRFGPVKRYLIAISPMAELGNVYAKSVGLGPPALFRAFQYSISVASELALTDMHTPTRLRSIISKSTPSDSTASNDS